MKKKVALVVMAIVMVFATPAFATTEGPAQKFCNSTSHVYVKSQWKFATTLYLDYHGYTGGAWDYTKIDSNSGTWEIDYLNTYAAGIRDEDIDWGTYKIYGQVLSTVYSWPGCEANQ